MLRRYSIYQSYEINPGITDMKLNAKSKALLMSLNMWEALGPRSTPGTVAIASSLKLRHHNARPFPRKEADATSFDR